MQEILWWWPSLIYFHDVFMNMFRKKWPYLLGRGWCFSPSCNSSSPKPNKKLRFLTSGGCKDEGLQPKKGSWTNDFLWCFPKFFGEDEANFGRRFFKWVARQFLLCRGRSVFPRFGSWIVSSQKPWEKLRSSFSFRMMGARVTLG